MKGDPILIHEFRLTGGQYRVIIVPTLYAKPSGAAIMGGTNTDNGYMYNNVIIETSNTQDLLTKQPVWIKITPNAVATILAIELAKVRGLIPEE